MAKRVLPDSMCDKLLGVGSRHPLPALRVIADVVPLPRDGLHRVVAGSVVQQLCPDSFRMLEKINAMYGTSPAHIAFGKEIYLSTTTLADKSIYSGTDPTTCGLAECKRKIMPGDFVSFACIASPPTHIYSAFPFLPISDFPSRNGLRMCKFHGLISLMPQKIAYLEPVSDQVACNSTFSF